MRFVVAAALALTVFLISGAAAAAAPEDEKAASGIVTILSTSDFHGQYRPIMVSPGNATAQTGDPGGKSQGFARDGKVGGLAVMAGLVDSIRKERGEENVLLVHAGDSFSDGLLMNLTEGEAMIRIMNAMRFQFMALGNHDFDYGYERLKQLQAMASFPMRGANVLERETPVPASGDPTLIVNAGGIRVGLLALGHHNTEQTGNPQNTRNLVFTSGIDAARKYVPILRERADVVVVVSHQGEKVDEMLAADVEGIDVIVGGHSHAWENSPGQPVIVQAMSDGTTLSEIVVRVENGAVVEVESKNHILWNDRYQPDERIAEVIDIVRAPHQSVLDAKVAVARERIGRRYLSESPFDILVGNVLMNETGAHLAMLPGTGYGVSLNPGTITREDLYFLLPHPDRLVTVDLSGKQILDVLEQSASNIDADNPMERVGGLIQTAGIMWNMDLNKPPGKRVSKVYVLLDGGEPIGKDKLYRVATHSGMVGGMHRYRTFMDGNNRRETGRKVADVMEKRLRQMGEVAQPKMGLVKIVWKKEKDR